MKFEAGAARAAGLVLAGIFWGIGLFGKTGMPVHAEEVCEQDAVASGTKRMMPGGMETADEEFTEAEPGECRILEVRIDGELWEETDIVYRNTDSITVQVSGEGTAGAVLLTSAEAGEREIPLEYEFGEEEPGGEGTADSDGNTADGGTFSGTPAESELPAWNAKAVVPTAEGTMGFTILARCGGETREAYVSPVICVDRTPPEAELFLSPAKGAAWGDGIGEIPGIRGAALLTLRVREEHWTPEGVQFWAGRKQAQPGDEVYQSGDLCWFRGEDENWQAELLLEEEGLYGASLRVCDRAGNLSGEAGLEFLLDGTGPEILGNTLWVSCEDTVLEEGPDGRYYGNGRMDVELKLQDMGSGPRKAVVYLRGADKAPQKWKEETWENPGTGGSLSFSVEEEGDWEIGVTAWDWNGNGKEEPVWLCSLCLEKEAPFITLGPGKGEGTNTIFRGDVRLPICARDGKSGLKTVSLTAGDRLVWRWPDKSGSAEEIEEEIFLAAKEFQGETQLTLTAADLAGNEASLTERITIDTEAPRIELEYEAQKAENGSYYAKPRRAMLRIWEEHFDAEGVSVQNGQNPMETPEFRNAGDGSCHEAELLFAAEGVYEIRVSCEDLAGNTGSLENIQRFVIDRTRPVIQVSYEEKEEKTVYFPEKRKAYIKVMETNPDEASFSWAAEKDGEPWKLPLTKESFRWKDGIGTAALVFEEEGRYSFSMQMKDLAGNEAIPYESPEFVLDFTAPKLSLENIRNYSSNTGEVCPQVTAADTGYREGSLRVRLCEGRDREVPQVCRTEETGERAVCTYLPWPKERELDGRYRLEAWAEDLAGNESHETWWFTVNRFGSEFTFGKDICGAEDKYYVNYVPDIRIVERNPDDILEHRILLESEDGIRILKEGADYQVTASGGGNEWRSYLYEVKGGVIEADGDYRLSLRTCDRAGNRMDTGKERSLAFCLDRTEPSVRITGIEGGTAAAGRRKNICVEIRDRTGVEEAVFWLNEKKAASYDREEVLEAGGIFRLAVDTGEGFGYLRIEAEDFAGNRKTAGPITVQKGRIREIPNEEEAESADENDTASADTAGGTGSMPKKRQENRAVVMGLLALLAAVGFMLVHIHRKRK